MSAARALQLVRLRNRLNDLGDWHYYAAHTAWDRKRIRARNRINARLARAGGAA